MNKLGYSASRPVVVPRDIDWVVDLVAAKHRTSRREVFSYFRDEKIAAARRELWWILRNAFHMSFDRIGYIFGYADHTSVRGGILRYQDEVSSGLAAPAVHPSTYGPPNLRYASRQARVA